VTRLHLLLLAALMASCLALVDSAYSSRRLFAQLDSASTEAHQLEVDYQRLQVERQAQATPMRVEKTARDKLGMRTATPAVTQYVADGAASAASGAAP